jgi:hypothetical protein
MEVLLEYKHLVESAFDNFCAPHREAYERRSAEACADLQAMSVTIAKALEVQRRNADLLQQIGGQPARRHRTRARNRARSAAGFRPSRTRSAAA